MLDRVSARRRTVIPRIFEVYVGGWAGPFFRVKLNGKNLDYEACARECGDRFENVSIEPSEEAWAAFWDTLERIGAWSWERSYFDPDTLDGTQWEVKIQLGRKRLKSDGSNSYPPNGDFDETREFRQFCSAISRLLGGKQFR